MTLLEILQRAEELSEKTIAGSITPDEVGGLIQELALQIQSNERDGATLGIRKVYPSLEAMQADSAPQMEDGKVLRRGNLVAIYDEATSSTDSNSGLVYMWTGTDWRAVARIGTALRHENTAIESRLTLIEGDIRDAVKLKLGELEEKLLTAITQRAEEHKEHDDRISSLEITTATAEALTQEQQAREQEDTRIASFVAQERGIRAEAISRLERAIEYERNQRGVLAEKVAEGFSKTSSGGYYNVTSLHPLSSGYYTKETAVSAIATANIPEAQRKGMIMTIEVAEGKWEDYRYTGATVAEQLASAALWVPHTALKGVRIGSELKEAVDGVIQLPELSVEVADSVDDSERPVSSRAVKAELESVKGWTLDSDTEATDEGTQVTLSQEGRQVAQFVVSGGGGGDTTTTKGKVTAQLSAPRIKLGDAAMLDYSWTHYSDGEQDGVGAELTLTIRRGVQTIVSESLGIKSSGERGMLDLKGYITSADSYNISITATYQEGDTTKTRTASAALSVVDLSISLYNLAEVESYHAAGGYKDGDSISISVVVRGGAKAISMYLDGERIPAETKAIIGGGSRQTFILPARSLRAGGHSLQFVASLDNILSNSLYIDILKAGADEPWVGLLLTHPLGTIYYDGATPRIYAAQYEQTQWHYIAIGRSGEGVASLSLQEGEHTIQLTAPRTYQRHTARYLSRGSISAMYRIERQQKAFEIEVSPSTLEGLGVKEGAVVELLASGRSNTEAKPNVWTSGKTETTFHGVDWRSSGWTGEALRLINGASANIGYPLFGTDAKTTGLTLLLELKATNVRQYDAPIVSSYDEEAYRDGEFAGVRITSERISMPTGGRVSFRTEDGEEVSRDLGLDMQYASGEFYHLALVVHPATDERTVRLYINGVLSKADTYQDTVFRQRTPQGIKLDSSGADLEVKQVRVYTTALTDDEVLSAYITDRPTLGEMQALRERNDVLDPQTGDISWEKLYQRGKGILSITLEDGGLERLWGKSTDTKTNHKLRELIFRSPYGRAYDLKVTDAAIRRQGTSTSTYPIKNLRIYLQRKGFETKVYRNTSTSSEDVWTLVPERTYKMRPESKAMSIINLKADYADSSLCYNTGGSILLDYLLRVNPSLQTPGMTADKATRFGIDGMPIDVFTADEAHGMKRYVGQFQFNNDKSKSGYLFGQTKKDGSEIALEFINNTNAVANFAISGDVSTQLASNGSDGFDASVEFLYPEKDYLWNGKKGVEDTAPENIKRAVVRLWQWVKDCLPSDTDPSRMSTKDVLQHFKSSKFKSELAQYFNPQNLALWWVWTDYTMAVDQRVKNTFLRTWDGQVWYLTYYDGDTSMGKRNDAFLAYLYNINRDTIDAQRNKYAFEGHASRLWALVIANMQDEIKAAAQTMRTTLTDIVFRRVYNSQIMGVWSERQYNKSGINKYIKPTYTDYNGTGTMNYIFALNGTMYAYRNQLIDRRFSLLDARYEVGAYHSDAVQGYIGKGAVETDIKITAGDEYYFGWRTQNGQLREHQPVASAGIATFHFPDAISQNDPVRLIGASRMLRLDLSTTAAYMQGAWNLNGCTILEELIAPVNSGRASQWYPLLSKITGLKRIDLTGQSGVTGTEDEQARTFDVRSHTGLEELKLRGTSVRGVRLALGCPIVRLELPVGLSYLSLRALPKLTESGLSLERPENVRSLELASCPGLDWRKLVERCTGLERLRVEGVDITDDGSILDRLSRLKGLDANGAGVDTCSLVGRCQLTKYIDDEVYARYLAHFPELTIRQAQYTVIELDDTVVDPRNMSNLDNSTGYKYGNEYKPSAHIARILGARFGCVGKQASKGIMQIYRLHPENWLKYADHQVQDLASEATVDTSEGDVFIYEPEYWYKGVNDVKSSKKYACYAYGSVPDSPLDSGLIKVITLDQIEEQGGKTSMAAVNSGGADERAILTADSQYISYKVDVSNYKKVRFPSVIGKNLYGAAFLDRQGRNIKGCSLAEGGANFFYGMYIIETIPPEAKYLYFCIAESYKEVDQIVVLSNSPKIEDIEPYWVHHKPTLVGAFRGSNCFSKYGSGIYPNQDNPPIVGQSYQQVSDVLSRRGLKILSYEQYKDIIQLSFVLTGTRNIVSVFGGDLDSSYRYLNGTCIKSGIYSTEYNNDNRKYGFYERNGAFRRWIDSGGGKVMGYERLLGGFATYLDGFTASMSSHNNYGLSQGTNKASLVRSDGAISYSGYCPSYDQRQARVTHGRYMDLLPLTPYQYGRVTVSTYYAQPSWMWSDYRGWSCLCIGSRNQSEGPLLFGKTIDPQNLTARIMFTGEILEVKDLEEYKKIKNFL